MARSALTAPAHVVAKRPALGNLNSDPNLAPSMGYGGFGLQDHRLQYNYINSTTGAQSLGWFTFDAIPVVDQVPSAIATANIAALANAVSGTAMTLVSTTGAGITVMASSLFALPSLTTIPSGTLAIDGIPGYVRFGLGDITAFHDPTKAIARAISITGVASGTGGAFAVVGFDLYGFPMHETITAGAGVSTVNGKKAWKFITSVTPQFSDAHTYSVGTTDIYGFGMRVDQWNYVDIYYGTPPAVLITASTGFVAADATSPATATTGDVRGTYAAQSASDGTKKLQIFVGPTLGQASNAAGAAVGFFGVAQF